MRLTSAAEKLFGKSKECLDLREADRDHTDPSKSYEELLTKVEDYSRSRKLDSSAKQKDATRR